MYTKSKYTGHVHLTSSKELNIKNMLRNRKTTALVYGKENSHNIQVQNVDQHEWNWQNVKKTAQ